VVPHRRGRGVAPVDPSRIDASWSPTDRFNKEKPMLTILLFVLVLMLLGALPSWGHSRSWGYYPSGGVGLVLLVLVVLMLSGRL
jgi:hypothetical protein